MKVEHASGKGMGQSVYWTQLWGYSVGLQILALGKENASHGFGLNETKLDLGVLSIMVIFKSLFFFFEWVGQKIEFALSDHVFLIEGNPETINNSRVWDRI